MVTLIEGRIGSGKSYFAVREILYTYYRFDEDKVRWVLREDLEQEVSIYTNIDGFFAAGYLEDAIKAAGGLENFMSDSYQRKFTKFKRHVYVFDEAQKSSLFHKKYYNPDVSYIFEYSRHYGLDIFLITQDIWKLSPSLVGLPEIHIKVQRRSLSLYKNSFVYMYMSDKDIVRKKTLRIDQRVFMAYRSQRVLSKDTVKSFSRRYAMIFTLLFCCVVGSFYLFTKSFFWTMENKGGNQKVSGKDIIIPEKVVARRVVAVVGDYVFYNQAGTVIREKRDR